MAKTALIDSSVRQVTFLRTEIFYREDIRKTVIVVIHRCTPEAHAQSCTCPVRQGGGYVHLLQAGKRAYTPLCRVPTYPGGYSPPSSHPGIASLFPPTTRVYATFSPPGYMPPSHHPGYTSRLPGVHL